MDSRPPSQPEASVAGRLLAWYDRHRRRLPWRALPGEPADPYRVWLSEIMLQQTTVATVGPYFERFTARWPTVAELAQAPLDDVLAEWAGLGYYARARNLHACARAVLERHGGAFPDEETALLALPGVGAYTAAAVAAIAFDRPATPLDGNIERVVARLFAVTEPLPGAKKELRRLAATLTPAGRPGDYAQAAIDLGATVCLPARPKCLLCPLESDCRARALGIAESLPAKAPKPEKPTRRGIAFVARRADGRVLLRRRPDKGLLGGMAEVPSTDWRPEAHGGLNQGGPSEGEALAQAPLPAAWDELPGLVRHTFTHFHLELTIWRAELPAGTAAPEGARWAAIDALAGEALPTVMRKVLRHGLG